MIVVLAAWAAAATGCGHRHRISADPLGAAPTDFSLEVTVLTPTPTPANALATQPARGAHLRQSRYVLFADGSLHHSDDIAHEKGADWLPPLTRVLTRRQVAQVWWLAQQLGFTDPENTSGAINFKIVPSPPPDRLTYLATFRGWGRRWTFERECAAAEPDPAMTQLTRELAQLAWSSDMPAAVTRIMPKRYDFGPDPYERYRQGGGAPAATTAPGEKK